MEKRNKKNQADKNEMFSKVYRNGTRTYFFDVKKTKGDEYYLTVTESKKRMDEAGLFFYEKHKLFLYKEDFEKFVECLSESFAFIRNIPIESPTVETVSPEEQKEIPSSFDSNFMNLDLEDLDK